MATFIENFSSTLIASFDSNLEAFWPQYAAILKANATRLGFCCNSTPPPIFSLTLYSSSDTYQLSDLKCVT